MVELLKEKDAFVEKIVQIRRVTRVVKGGKKLSFRSTIVVGDENGKVGVGIAKSTEVPASIKKASNIARKNMIDVNVVNGTIPHDVIGKLGASKIFIKPAPKGTGVIAGGVVRIVLELAGIHNVLAKSLGASSPINNAYATIDALKNLKTLNKIRKDRGIDVKVRYIE